MTPPIDYYFSLVSPWTYLGSQRFAALAARHNAPVNVKPVDLGRIFPVSGGVPLAKRATQRQAYRLVELARWRDFLELPLTLHPKYFPAPSELASCLVLAARAQERDALALAHAILRGVWAEEKNIADPPTLAGIAADCGFDGAALLRAADSDEMRQAYGADTDEAIARGVFGSPTYMFRGELFWGQDRLDFLDRALAKASGQPVQAARAASAGE